MNAYSLISSIETFLFKWRKYAKRSVLWIILISFECLSLLESYILDCYLRIIVELICALIVPSFTRIKTDVSHLMFSIVASNIFERHICHDDWLLAKYLLVPSSVCVSPRIPHIVERGSCHNCSIIIALLLPSQITNTVHEMSAIADPFLNWKFSF